VEYPWFRQMKKQIGDLEPVQNLIIKAYEHLKTLPEFNGATDC